MLVKDLFQPTSDSRQSTKVLNDAKKSWTSQQEIFETTKRKLRIYLLIVDFLFGRLQRIGSCQNSCLDVGSSDILQARQHRVPYSVNYSYLEPLQTAIL